LKIDIKAKTKYLRRKSTIRPKITINEDDFDDIYVNEIQKINENEMNSESIIDSKDLIKLIFSLQYKCENVFSANHAA
jgi:chorismate mutase